MASTDTIVTVLVFEPQAAVLDRAAGVLRSRGLAVVACYSDAKLDYEARRLGHVQPLIVCPVRCQAAASNAVPGAATVSYGDDETFDDADSSETRRVVTQLEKLRRKHRTTRRSDRKTRTLELLAIGASTGGFPVMQNVLRGVRPQYTAILLCQHISADMSKDLARRACDAAPVNVVRERTAVRPGGVYFLAGGQDFVVRAWGDELYLAPVAAGDTPYHPSVSRLFDSLASATSGKGVAAMILSGLGDDGADAFRALETAGIISVAQTPASAKAPSMPTAAIATQCVDHVYDVDQLRDFVRRRVR